MILKHSNQYARIQIVDVLKEHVHVEEKIEIMSRKNSVKRSFFLALLKFIRID